MKEGNEKKISAESIIDDLLGGLTVGIGSMTAVGVSTGISSLLPEKVGTNKDFKPLLIGLGITALGVAGRIGSAYIKDKKWKEVAKDFANGFIAAGSVDSAVKTADLIYPEWRAMLPAKVASAIESAPALGAFTRGWSPNTPLQVFNGFNGVDSSALNGEGIQTPQVLSSALLN